MEVPTFIMFAQCPPKPSPRRACGNPASAPFSGPRDIEPLGVSFPELQRLVSEGTVEKVGPGLYRLAAAKPDELVTFYRRISDASTGLAYTTGGLFKRGDYLYLVLANCRQEPADAMSRITPGYEIDPIDEPLLPLRRAGYTVSFVPSEAEVHAVEGQWRWNFPDPRKIVIVDLILALQSLNTDYQTH